MLGCIGRPASLSLHIETTGSEKTMTFLLNKLHFAFKIASLCWASNLLRRIFIINKSYLNKRILFNSFTYESVCVFYHSPLPSHITGAAGEDREAAKSGFSLKLVTEIFIEEVVDVSTSIITEPTTSRLESTCKQRFTWDH